MPIHKWYAREMDHLWILMVKFDFPKEHRIIQSCKISKYLKILNEVLFIYITIYHFKHTVDEFDYVHGTTSPMKITEHSYHPRKIPSGQAPQSLLGFLSTWISFACHINGINGIIQYIPYPE